MADILKRDENHITVSAAVTSDASKDVTMLRVDPVSKYLLVNISTTGSTSATSTQIAKRDENHVPVCLAWDDTNKILQEVLTDTSGNLLCDVVLI